MELYHGSNVRVKKPEIRTSGHYKDFGFGFYCTNKKSQALRWALTKKTSHVLNIYEYREFENLKQKHFLSMTEEWLDFVAECRNGKSHEFDIVEGPMADDTIWNYVEDFLSGLISRAAFWELVKFKYPTHQIVFCNDHALQSLTYKGCEQL